MFKYFIIGLLLFASSNVFGQFMLGAKASYTSAFVDQSEQLYDNSQNYVIYRLELEKQQVLPSVGLIAYYGFENRFENRNLSAFVQGELLYNFRRTHFTFENYLTNASPQIQTYRKGVGFLRFPMMGGFQYRFLKIGVGPIFSFVVNEQKVFTSFPTIDEQYRRFEPASSILIGVRVDDFVVDVTYEYHFNGVSEFIYYKDRISGFREQPNYLSINVNYFFNVR